MNKYYWQLPTHQSNVTCHNWIHYKAKLHCYCKEESLCKRHAQDEDFEQYNLEEFIKNFGEKAVCPICLKKYKKRKEEEKMEKISITSTNKRYVIKLLLNSLPYPDTFEECDKYYKEGLMTYTGGFVDKYEWNKIKFFSMSLDDQLIKLMQLYEDIDNIEIEVSICLP